MGFSLYVFIDDLDQLGVVLNSKDCQKRPAPVQHLGAKRGVVALEDADWKTHRKLIEPAFSPSILKTFLPIFNEKAKIFVKVLQAKVNEDQFNIHEPLLRLTLDYILSTSTGLKRDVQTETGANTFVEQCNQ